MSHLGSPPSATRPTLKDTPGFTRVLFRRVGPALFPSLLQSHLPTQVEMRKDAWVMVVAIMSAVEMTVLGFSGAQDQWILWSFNTMSLPGSRARSSTLVVHEEPFPAALAETSAPEPRLIDFILSEWIVWHFGTLLYLSHISASCPSVDRDRCRSCPCPLSVHSCGG